MLNSIPGLRRSSLAALCCGVTAACSDAPSQPTPPAGTPGIRIVAGAGVTDTIDALQSQALLVEVRGPDGQLAKGVQVRFIARTVDTTDPLNVGEMYVCGLNNPYCSASPYSVSVRDSTDSLGRARVQVRMGRVPGRMSVQIAVPTLGLVDTASYTVNVGAVGGVRLPAADTALDLGERVVLRGLVTDRAGNTRPEVAELTTSPGARITVDAATATVTAADIGEQTLFARYQTFVDSTAVRVVPAGRLFAWSQQNSSLQIRSINGRGVPRTLFTRVLSEDGVFPRFSSDRVRMSFQRNGGTNGGGANTIMVVDSSGASLRIYNLEAQVFNIVATRVMTDGTLIVICRLAPLSSFPGLTAIRIAEDGAISVVASIPETAVTPLGGADIAPDGRRVVYVSRSANEASELRVIDLQTKAVTVLAPSGNSPRWSPSGDQIAFLSGDASPPLAFLPYALQVIRTDGTGLRRLSTRIFTAGIAWSPDGTYIVGNAGSSLYVTRVRDGAEVLLRLRNASGALDDFAQVAWP